MLFHPYKTGTVVEHEGPTSYGIEFGYVIIEYDHETTADGEIKPGGTARLFPRLHRMRILEPANPPTAPAAAQAAMPVTPAQQKGPYPRTMRGRKQRSQASTLHDADGNFLFPPENAAVVPDPSSGNDGANVDNNGGGACVGGSGGSGGGELAKKGGTGRGNTQCPDCGNTARPGID